MLLYSSVSLIAAADFSENFNLWSFSSLFPFRLLEQRVQIKILEIQQIGKIWPSNEFHTKL